MAILRMIYCWQTHLIRANQRRMRPPVTGWFTTPICRSTHHESIRSSSYLCHITSISIIITVKYINLHGSSSNLILQVFNPDFNIFNLSKSTIINLSPIQHVFYHPFRNRLPPRRGTQPALPSSASCLVVDPRALGAQFAADLFHPNRAQGILSCQNKASLQRRRERDAVIMELCCV